MTRQAEEEDLRATPTNLAERERIHALVDHILTEALRRGWHGEVTVLAKVQDGVLQCSRGEAKRSILSP